MAIRKLSRFALLKIWGRYRLGERRSDMAKEFGVSRSLIYGHLSRIDRTMKHPLPNVLEHYCHGDRQDIIQSDSPGRLPEGFGRLDPDNDKQMATILPMELFLRIESKIDGVVFRNRSQLVRTALIEWLDRDDPNPAELNKARKQKADKLLRRSMVEWLKIHSTHRSV